MPTFPISTRARPTHLVVLYGFLIVAVIAARIIVILADLRSRALADRQRELQNIALVLAEQTDRTFQALDLVHTSLIERIQALGITSGEEFDRKLSGYDVHLLLKEKIDGLSHAEAIALFNANGKLVNFSRFWPSPVLSISEQEHFGAFISDPRLTSYVSRPFQNRTVGTWSIILARRIAGQNGEFLGLMATEMSLQFFDEYFRSIRLGQESVISLLRRDGVRLVRQPAGDDPGRSYAEGALFADVLSHADHGVVQLKGMDDGVERLIAGHRVAHYPVVIAVGATVSAALAEWRVEAAYMIRGAIVLAMVIIGTVLLGTRQLKDYELRMKAEAEREQKALLDTALNNMSQGLCMFDSNTRLVFCNQRYIDMYRLSPEVIRPGLTLRELIDRRKETGSFAGDPEQYCSELLTRVALKKTTSQSVATADGRIIHIVTRPMANRGWVATHEDITERRRAEDERDRGREVIARLAHYDSLTDLSNRLLFFEQLDQALACARRGDRLSVLYIDLDHFKRVNDTLGHSVGDALLRNVAARLRDCVGEADLVGRLGGDEFAVLQRSIETATDAASLARRIRAAIEAPYELNGRTIVTDASIGISIAPDDSMDRDQLLKYADLALYAAKGNGRGSYCFYESEMDARIKARQQLEGDLRDALSKNQFELYYQPILNLASNRVSGCEALLRWHDSERGMVPPSELIPVAEESGLIVQLGEWVLRQACRDAAKWPDDKRVAVNVSAVQLTGGSLVPVIVNALAESGLPASRLELEFTETVLMQNTEDILAPLRQLHDLGVRIAMDDFGIGYSSLSYLRSFPFDSIKIDRSFIEGLSGDGDCVAIVQAVTTLAHRLNMTTTAEGIETEQQQQRVRELGCTELQGFLFSPPRPVEEIIRLFMTQVDRPAHAA